MGTTTAKVKYKYIGEFAELKGITRAWAARCLDDMKPEVWKEYADFIEAKAVERRRVVAAAKERIDRASKLAESENIDWHRREIARTYGNDFETFTK